MVKERKLDAIMAFILMITGLLLFGYFFTLEGWRLSATLTEGAILACFGFFGIGCYLLGRYNPLNEKEARWIDNG